MRNQSQHRNPSWNKAKNKLTKRIPTNFSVFSSGRRPNGESSQIVTVFVRDVCTAAEMIHDLKRIKSKVIRRSKRNPNAF